MGEKSLPGNPSSLNKVTCEILTTAGCHLCEQVEEMIDYWQRNDSSNQMVEFQLVDIALDDALVEQYGIRIPVLRFVDLEEAELGWPFDFEALDRWLKKYGKLST